MSNYNSLKTTIDANIKQNGNQEITGQILNSVLNQMVTTLGAGYQFAGVATLDPATDPGTPDAKVFYIANGKGTYEKFGGIEVTEDDVVILYWDTAWHKVSTGIATQAKLSELEGKVDELYLIPMYNSGYINTAGEVEPSASYKYSNPIKLKSGQTVSISTVASASGTAVVAKYENGTYLPIVTPTGVVSIKYTAKEEGLYVFTIPTSGTVTVEPLDYSYLDNSVGQMTAKQIKFGGLVNNNAFYTFQLSSFGHLDQLILKGLTIAGGRGIEVSFYNGNTLLGTYYGVFGTDVVLINPFVNITVDKVSITNRTGSSFTLGSTYQKMHTEYLEVSAVSDNGFINSVIKELYFSGVSFSALGLENEKEVAIHKGAMSSGKYRIGLVFGSDISYCREYNTLEEAEAADLSVVELNTISKGAVVADWSFLNYGEVSETYLCKFNPDIQNPDFSPRIKYNIDSVSLANDVKAEMQVFSDSKVLNVTKEFPTGGINGTEYYDLETAVTKVTSNIATVGLILIFRPPISVVQYSTYARVFILEGITSGGGGVQWFNNPANYRELKLKNDTFDVSYSFPDGGDNGDGRYYLLQAAEKVPVPLRYYSQKIRFVNKFGNTEVWKFVKQNASAADYISANGRNWVRIDTPQDYLGNCDNRLANPLYETFEHYNSEHQATPIQAVVTNPLNNADNVLRRIPTCIVTNAGTILTACQKQDSAQGDFGFFSIEVSRKANGGSWSSGIVVPYVSETTTWRCNCAFLVERDNSQGHQGRIYLFFGSFSSVAVWWEQTTQTSDFNYIYSDDDGLTWSNIQSLKAGWNTDEYKFTIPSCTNGIQLVNGTLVVPCMCVLNGAGNNSSSHILYKTPNGDWTFSNTISTRRPYEEMDECTIVEADDNVVTLIPRNNNTGGLFPWSVRYIYDFLNDSWSEKITSFFQKQSCCLSVDKFKYDNSSIYLMSLIDTFDGRKGRVNITIWVSTDLDKWVRVYRAYKPAGNGYSVVSNYGGKIIVVYETSATIELQDISVLSSLLANSTAFLDEGIGVQDRIQLLFNKANGIE